MTKNELAEDFIASLTPSEWFKASFGMKLYDYQAEFVNNPARYRIVNKSRQVGMTFIIAREAIKEALTKPASTILIVSVADRQAQHVMNYIKQALQQMEPQPKLSYNTKSEVKFEANGARIVSLPNSPATVRGYPADHVYVDEGAHIQNDREMWQAIVPSTSRGGRLTVISTPFGKRGQFWNTWSKANELGYTTQLIPWSKCPELKLSDIKKQFGDMDEITFRQEFECEFVDEAVSFFPYDLIQGVIDPEMDLVHDASEIPDAEGSTFFAGVDFAKIRDETVITVVERKRGGRFIVRAMTVFSTTPYKTQLAYIKGLPSKFPLQNIYIDSTTYGVPLQEELFDSMGHMLVGINFNVQSKEKMITQLKILFETKKINIPDNMYLISQLHQLERTETQGGMVRYRHEDGKHDDAVWSLALACYAGSGVESEEDIAIAINSTVPDHLNNVGLADIEYRLSNSFGDNHGGSLHGPY